MSVVCNVILKTPLYIDDKEKAVIEKSINQYFNNQRGFVNVDNDNLPSGWYGGAKMLEAELWIGAFNYLDLEGFVEHLKKINWNTDCDDWVQVIYQKQEDDKFSIIEFEVKKGEPNE